MDQREIYRLQRENDRYRRELAQQASRYEDRITELHGVLEELKRKTAGMHNSTSATHTTVGVDELVEVSDSDGEPEAACTSSESVLQSTSGQDARSELLVCLQHYFLPSYIRFYLFILKHVLHHIRCYSVLHMQSDKYGSLIIV